MAKLVYKYWSNLNLCWTEKTITFDTYEEAESYLEDVAKYDRIEWAYINSKPIEWI